MNWKLGEYDGLMHVSDWLPTIISLVQQRAWKSSGITLQLPDDLDGKDMSEALAVGSESPRKSVLPQVDIIINSTTYRNGWYVWFWN